MPAYQQPAQQGEATMAGTTTAGEMSRAEVMDAVRTIWRLSMRLKDCGQLDIEGRAAEIAAMSHYMLYDDDAGVEDLR
jgi:hypothetical protein